MSSAYDQQTDAPKKGKTIKSAYESESFDADWTIHVDGLVGSATISPSGRDVALASPDGLAIIDLDSPYSPPRRLSSRGLPWLVVDVQWSPFAARDYWVASTANHRCLVWNLNLRDDSATGPVEHSLQAHSRAITDINFSAHHPDLLATCAVDGNVHYWDLRRPRQPTLSFCDWTAGATQVKYSRQDPHVLASSHDRKLHIWDDRRPTAPLKTIIAHSSKIYGLDWNRTRATGLATCSLDRSIKFWDYKTADDVPERIIRTDFPVWRARHTPFGWGLLAMPQNEPGKLYLYDRRSTDGAPTDSKPEPVEIFAGHGNHKAKEFLWRCRGGYSDDGSDNRDFQLVSWGEDKELRVQKVDPEVLERVGYIKGGPARKDLIITRKGANYKTFRTVDDGAHRDRRNATMTDPRPNSSGGALRRSVLSTGIQTPYYKTLSTWRPPSMKAKTASKAANRGQLQIGWMKGVTMNKRKTASDALKRSGTSKGDSFFGQGYYDNDWGEPEPVQDEVVRISRQLPNVKLEHIDIDNLVLKASLKGPWGTSGENIFIKVKVDIPQGYPDNRAPKFSIEKSTFMADETYLRLERDAQILANQFAQRKKNCLDVVFTFLLGEVDLETSTTLFKNVRDFDDENGGLVVDSSSSDEDDNGIPPGGSASMSQELPGGPSTIVEPSNALGTVPFRVTMPPSIRTCGARFSNDGRLVCFFPTKEEKAKALLSSVAVSTDPVKERPKGEPRFAGFGRLAPDSPPPKHRHRDEETSATDDNATGVSDDSDDSDNSSASSSSSSSSTDSELRAMSKLSFWYRPGRRLKKTWSAGDSVRSSGGGTGTGTGTGTGAGTIRRRIPARPKNILSIRDMRHLLPSKKQFAQEYAIFGEGTDVCEHNAKVAEKYGHADLVDIWRYSALLLRSDIPLMLAEQSLLLANSRRRSVLVIARDAVSRYHDNAAASSSAGLTNAATACEFTGRVKWGHHPLAHEFIDDLFNHFERLADVQMLAMLSCIFADYTSPDDNVAYAESHLSQPETPLPMKAPAFSLEYFPTDPELWHKLQHGAITRSQVSSAITTPRTSQTPVHPYAASLGGSDDGTGVWTGDPASNSYSCGETPPLKPGRDHLGETEKSSQSLSSSPNTRSFRRTNSAIATMAASLPRTLQGMVSSSPPEPPTAHPPARKRPSPSEAILSSLAPAVTWGASTVFGTTSAAAAAAAAAAAVSRGSTAAVEEGYEPTHIRQQHHAQQDMNAFPEVVVVLENEGLFDDDGWLATPFLEPDRNSLYASYRHAYAELLHIWGQPLARLEIMKFNVLNIDDGADSAAESILFGTDGAQSDSSFHEVSAHVSDAGVDGGASQKKAQRTPAVAQVDSVASGTPGVGTTPGTMSPSFGLTKRSRPIESALASGRGLDVTGICLIHETNLEPLQYVVSGGGPSATLPSSSKASSPQAVIARRRATLAKQHRQQQQPLQGSTTVGGAVGICERCGPPGGAYLQSQLRCVYCTEPVVALYPACLGCGCPSHDYCLAEWHAMGERFCPAGDECDCVAEATSGQVESWTAMQAALALQAATATATTPSSAPPPSVTVHSSAKRRKAVTRVPSSAILPGRKGADNAVFPSHHPPIPLSPGAPAPRPRRKSMPGHIGLGATAAAGDADDDGSVAGGLLGGGDDDDEDSGGGIDREDWETVASGPNLPSASAAGAATARPSTGGAAAASSLMGSPASTTASTSSRLLPRPSVAAQHLSRLKKQVGEMGRPSILRQRSGGIQQKKPT